MSNLTYNEVLRHPFWQKKKAEICQRDNWACKKCGDTLSLLVVHHLYYKPNTEPWDYPNEALVTLCELCHEKTHFRDYLRKNMPKLMKDGFTFGDIKTLENTVMDKLWSNDHKESARRYMDLIRKLVDVG